MRVDIERHVARGPRQRLCVTQSLRMHAAQAEALFPIDPAASISKLRLFGELLAQERLHASVSLRRPR